MIDLTAALMPPCRYGPEFSSEDEADDSELIITTQTSMVDAMRWPDADMKEETLTGRWRTEVVLC